jgi:hypothetical protein
MTRKPIHRPAQFALGFSELEWQGYKAACIRVQQQQQQPRGMQDAALSSTDAECSKKGPDASPGPIG